MGSSGNKTGFQFVQFLFDFKRLMQFLFRSFQFNKGFAKHFGAVLHLLLKLAVYLLNFCCNPFQFLLLFKDNCLLLFSNGNVDYKSYNISFAVNEIMTQANLNRESATIFSAGKQIPPMAHNSFFRISIILFPVFHMICLQWFWQKYINCSAKQFFPG